MPRSFSSQAPRTPLDRPPRRAPQRAPRTNKVMRRAKTEEPEEKDIPIEVTTAKDGQAHPIHRIWPTERIVSREEKRQLILAHASARAAKGVGGIWTYYIGIAASFLIVGTGWWLTVGNNIRQRVLLSAHEPGILEQVQQESNALEQRFQLPAEPAFKDRLLELAPGTSTASSTNHSP